MAKVVVLDSEALSAIAFARERGAASARARAVLTLAHESGAAVRVPVAVLAEVCRGDARDAAIMRVLSRGGIGVTNLDTRIARRAALRLTKAHLDSKHAIDAFVVATAAVLGSAIIATHYPGDLRRLAAAERDVTIVPI